MFVPSPVRPGAAILAAACLTLAPGRLHAQPANPADVEFFERNVRPVLVERCLSCLAPANLKPNPPADRRTLIRRATFDLHGLPPTPEEIDAFVNDPDPDAYLKLIDRLLDSPRYGERWGRHWLDVARYADNKGYVFFEDTKYPWAWTYRDYVISALNRDVPFDRFVLEQLAADRLDLEDRRSLAALGFLTAGG